MIKRTIEISRERAHLTVRLDQLVLERDGQVVGSIPCEDIGVVMVDHQGTTYTHAALARLAQQDATVVVCGRDHLPAGILLPLADHSQVVWRIRDQIDVAKPVRKQLWRQIVQAKIRAQACNLSPGPARTRLLNMVREVRSGDVENHEAQAARLYWQAWSDEPAFRRASEIRQEAMDENDDDPDEPKPRRDTAPAFRRDRDGAPPNNLLNYGYAVLRAAVARALVAAGLLPAIGLHHSNRSNAFCLADDLMEPLRPLVDHAVRQLVRAGRLELDQPAKAELLKVLTVEVQCGELSGPLLVSLHRLTAGLVRCYRGESQKLEIPRRKDDGGRMKDETEA
ncbi:MAG: CRISPR-associated endonuclease Cas1 [Pirellulales bacterium]